jgi:hypothetical protein
MSASEVPRRPAANEYAEYYAGYVSQVPDHAILDILKDQQASTMNLLAGIPEAKHDYRYAPAKWTVKEVVGHLVDTEWVFTYRALRFARSDGTPLPGMDQDQFMAEANFEDRSLQSLVDEFRNLRSANLSLFESFDEGILDKTGMASDCTFTVRAILYIIAGHQIHHINILKERYL